MATELTAHSDQLVISLCVGDECQVTLEEPTTAGYVWQLSQLPKGLYFTHDAYIQDENEAVGGFPDRVWHFIVAGPVSGELAFVCKRPFEPLETKPVRQWACQLHTP